MRYGQQAALSGSLTIISIFLVLINPSTINHSSTAEELAHAIQLSNPNFFIVDASVKRKLDEAIALIERGLFASCQIITLVARVGHYPLVIQPQEQLLEVSFDNRS